MAGLLDFASLYGDPSSAGLLGTASGLMKAGGPSPFPVSFGQAMGQGFLTGFSLWNEAEQAKRRSQLVDAQVAHLGAQTGAIGAEAELQRKRIEFLTAPYTPPTPDVGAPRVTLEGGMSLPGGGQANLRTGEYSPPQAARPQVDPRLLDPNWVLKAKALGIDVTQLHQQYTTPQKRESGATYVDPVTGATTHYPNLLPGQTMVGGRIVNTPGAVASDVETRRAQGEVVGAADRARAEADRLKNWYDTGQWLSLPWERPPTGPRPAPGPAAASGGAPGPAPSPTPAPAPGPAAPGPQAAGAPMETTSGRFDPGEVGPRPANVTPRDWSKRMEEQPQVAGRLQNLMGQYERMRVEAQGLYAHPGLPGIYGVRGAVKDIPGSAAANARVKLNGLIKQVAANALQTMRDMSKTGGALGNTSDRDIELLERQLGNLDSAQSVEQAKQVLSNIIKFTETSSNNLRGIYDSTYNIRRVQPSRPAPIIPPGRRMPGGAGDLNWPDLTGGG